MRVLRKNQLGPVVSVLLLLVVTMFSGCTTIKIVGDYDDQIDKGITLLQKDTETFLVELESIPGSKLDGYDKNKAFYGKAKVAISSLRVRADATERNSLTVRMLDHRAT